MTSVPSDPTLPPSTVCPERTFEFAAEAVSDVVRAGGGEAVYESHRSPDKDTANEDGLLVISVDADHAVLAVADGLGGHHGGALASKIALEQIFAAVMQALGAGREIRDGILDGFELANQGVLALGTGAGTTLAVAEISAGMVRTYHVGDSAIVHCGGGGKIKQETIMHSPTGYAVESGLLSAEDALEHEERHLVSNIVGSKRMSIDIGSPRKVASRDTILLATDGLFDNFEAESVVEQVRKGKLPTVTTELVARCRERMGGEGKADDLTVISWRPRAVRRTSARK